MEKPNYTQMPNVLLDHLPNYSDAELRVMLCMCRQTFGFHKDRTIMMSSSFMAKGTGMSQQGVMNAVKSLMKQKLISRIPSGLSFAYQVDLEPPNKPLNGVEGFDETTPKRRLGVDLNGVWGSGRKPLNGVEGKKERLLKETKEKAVAKAPAMRILTDLWMQQFEAFNHRRYVFQNAKDGKAALRLLANGLTPEEIISVARRAWSRPGDFNCKAAATIAGLSCRWNDIQHELKLPPKPAWNGNHNQNTNHQPELEPRYGNGF